MPKKKQQKAEEPPPRRPCHVAGCGQNAEYKAPRSRDSLHDYEWYCLDHIRERNAKWDFFAGMERDAIENFMRDAVTGHRPTWRREENLARYYDELQAALDGFLGLAPKSRKPEVQLTPKMREALAAFDIDYPFTEKDLKLRYRELVKRFHPDANKGDRKAEERFKEITAAYLLLTQYLKNPD